MTDEKGGKTTANADIEAIQPGGTRPAPDSRDGATPHPDVESGDRNRGDKTAQTRIP